MTLKKVKNMMAMIYVVGNKTIILKPKYGIIKLKGDLEKELNKIEKYVKNKEAYNPDLDYIEKTSSDLISLEKELDELYEIRDILKGEEQ